MTRISTVFVCLTMSNAYIETMQRPKSDAISTSAFLWTERYYDALSTAADSVQWNQKIVFD